MWGNNLITKWKSINLALEKFWGEANVHPDRTESTTESKQAFYATIITNKTKCVVSIIVNQNQDIVESCGFCYSIKYLS